MSFSLELPIYLPQLNRTHTQTEQLIKLCYSETLIFSDTDLLQDLSKDSVPQSKLKALVAQQRKDIDHALKCECWTTCSDVAAHRHTHTHTRMPSDWSLWCPWEIGWVLIRNANVALCWSATVCCSIPHIFLIKWLLTALYCTLCRAEHGRGNHFVKWQYRCYFVTSSNSA